MTGLQTRAILVQPCRPTRPTLFPVGLRPLCPHPTPPQINSSPVCIYIYIYIKYIYIYIYLLDCLLIVFYSFFMLAIACFFCSSRRQCAKHSYPSLSGPEGRQALLLLQQGLDNTGWQHTMEEKQTNEHILVYIISYVSSLLVRPWPRVICQGYETPPTYAK